MICYVIRKEERTWKT